jgi:hypothetical protein
MQARLRVKLGALAVVSSTAALVLSGGTALASSHAGARSVTGPEVISGALHGKAAVANNPIVPVTLRGVVSAHGTLSLGTSKSKTHTVSSSAGNLVVQGTGYKHATQTENMKTCRFTFTQDITFNVLGGKSTGAFAGTSGPGAAQVYFAAFEPRYTSGKHKGQCNGNANPLAKGAVASFLASVVLTVKR